MGRQQAATPPGPKSQDAPPHSPQARLRRLPEEAHALVRHTHGGQVRIEVHSLPKERSVVADGHLFQEVQAKDCTWAVEDDKKAVNSQEEPVEVQDEQPAEAASEDELDNYK